MPAIAQLKTMPSRCIDCPLLGYEVMGKRTCYLLEYNNEEYDLDEEFTPRTQRRAECPLKFADKEQ